MDGAVVSYVTNNFASVAASDTSNVAGANSSAEQKVKDLTASQHQREMEEADPNEFRGPTDVNRTFALSQSVLEDQSGLGTLDQAA